MFILCCWLVTLGHVVFSIGISLLAVGLGMSCFEPSGPSVQVGAVVAFYGRVLLGPQSRSVLFVAFCGLYSVVLGGLGAPAGVLVSLFWWSAVLVLRASGLDASWVPNIRSSSTVSHSDSVLFVLLSIPYPYGPQRLTSSSGILCCM